MEVLCNDVLLDVYSWWQGQWHYTEFIHIYSKESNKCFRSDSSYPYNKPQALVKIYQHITVWSPEEYRASCNSAGVCFASLHRALGSQRSGGGRGGGWASQGTDPGPWASITHESKGRKDLASTHASSQRRPSTSILAQIRTSHAKNPRASGWCSF